MTPISQLRDNFTDNVQADVWAASGTSGSANYDETGGQGIITLPSSTVGTHLAYYRTTKAYDLTADSFYWNIGTMVSTSVAATAQFDLFLDTTNVLRWTQTSGTLKAQTILAGVVTDRYSVAWNATTYKYLRIRESGGNVLFDSSTNGTAWTNRASVAAPFAVTALYVQFVASCGNVASPGSLRLDDVNLILPALATNWHWTQVEWPLLYRFRSITLAASSGQGYIATSNDGTTWVYYSGPIGSGSGGYDALMLQSTQAAAQAMAVNLPSDGRWDLPTIVECRFIRLYHRSITGSSYTLREYYPRRLVQSDDMEAESIRAINIAAGAITADKITSLTITGKQIRTSESGARAVMSGEDFGGFIGYGASDTYNPADGTGTYQLLWKSSDGKLYAGTGNVILDSSGMQILAPTTSVYDSTRAIDWLDNTSTRIASVRAYYAGGLNDLVIEATNQGSRPGTISLAADSTRDSSLILQGGAALSQAILESDLVEIYSTASSDGIHFYSNGAATPDVSITTSGLAANVLSNLSNVQADSGAFGDVIAAATRLQVKSTGTTSATYIIGGNNSANANQFYVRSDGAGFINAVAWTYTSDERLKEKIKDNDRGLVHLKQLKPKKFDYIDGQKEQMGFLAADVQQVMPELVVPIDPNDTSPTPMLGMLTTALIPVMVSAIQELSGRVEALEAKE